MQTYQIKIQEFGGSVIIETLETENLEDTIIEMLNENPKLCGNKYLNADYAKTLGFTHQIIEVSQMFPAQIGQTVSFQPVSQRHGGNF